MTRLLRISEPMHGRDLHEGLHMRTRVLIRAFASVATAVPDTNLTIGGGAERIKLKALAASLAPAESIEFCRALNGEALAKKLQCHRCLVVPSVWNEPFGIVALEGIACCETVVATDRGGLPEAVGPCGTVVEPMVEALAAAMREVAQARARGNPLPGTPDEATRSSWRPTVWTWLGPGIFSSWTPRIGVKRPGIARALLANT